MIHAMDSAIIGVDYSAALAVEIIAEQEADHLREIRRLDDIAYAFLRATDGDQVEAEKLFEDCIEVLVDGGTLLMWKYRIVLRKIREGL
jgi:hypothetical protein